MNIRGKNKDIVEIRMGHESGDNAIMYIVQNKLTESGNITPIIDAYTEGFQRGIEFLANYLKEYDIQIELFDKVVETNNREDWYSGEIIEKDENK